VCAGMASYLCACAFSPHNFPHHQHKTRQTPNFPRCTLFFLLAVYHGPESASGRGAGSVMSSPGTSQTMSEAAAEQQQEQQHRHAAQAHMTPLHKSRLSCPVVATSPSPCSSGAAAAKVHHPQVHHPQPFQPALCHSLRSDSGEGYGAGGEAGMCVCVHVCVCVCLCLCMCECMCVHCACICCTALHSG